MADNGDWSAVPSGAVPLQVQYANNDRLIQARHPNWPTGGTAAQIGVESNGDNNAVSPKGATGIAQMMPSTFDAISKQMGRKLDIHNVNDQMAAHAFLMKQNLDRTNGDVTGALNLYNSGRAVADNPETQAYAPSFYSRLGQHQGAGNGGLSTSNSDDGGWTKSDPPPGWTPSGPPPNAARDFLNQTKQGIDKSVQQVQGLGEVVASGLSGLFGQAAGLLHGGAELAQGHGLDAAKQAFNQEVEPVTYQPRTPEGQAANQRLGEGYDQYIENPAEKISQFGAGLLTSNPKAQEYAKTYADVLTGIAAAVIGSKAGSEAGRGPASKGIKAPGAASELDKLNALQNPPAPEGYEPMGPFPEGGGPLQGQPNAGPQRAPFIAGPEGIDTGLPPSEAGFWERRAAQMEQAAKAQTGPNAGPQFPGGMRPNEGPQLRTKEQRHAAAKAAEVPLTGPEYPPNAGPQIPNAQAFARGIMQPAEPNMGPQRPPIPVGENGIATPVMGPEAKARAQFLQAAQDQARAEAQAKYGTETPGNPAQPDLFGGFPEDYNGTQRVNFETAEPELGRNFRQRSFDFEQPNPPDVLYGNEKGEVGTQLQREAVDPVQRRISDMQSVATEALDPESGAPHPNEGKPAERTLAPDEFKQAVQTIAAKDPEKFSVPADMDKAFTKYIDIVKGTLDPKKYADRFVKAVRDQMKEDRVANHPTVKANQARVDQLRAQLEAKRPGGIGDTTLQKQLDTATKTLEKSKENIGKALGDDPRLPYEKDGVVNMFTFGHLPELMRSIGAILKALHGVVFRTLDRVIPDQKNLNSTGRIIAQGIKNKVAEQATKTWETKVNEKPAAKLDGIPGLREGLKDYLPFEARDDLSPEQLKSNMQKAPDLSPGTVKNFMRTQFLTGQQLAAFSKHPLVKFAVETVDRAMRNSQQFVREQLVGKGGLRESMRAMTKDEAAGIWTLMQQNEGKRAFSDAELKRAGYSDKPIDFYRKFSDLQKQKLDNLNRGRAVAGLKPVDARIAYIAGHFLGDFKRVITKDGKVVAVIAHNLRQGVDVISKRVMEQLGEGHELGPIEMRKAGEGMEHDRYIGYMNILNDMAGRDDVVAKVAEAYRDYQTSDAQAAMKYRAAFKSNEGVIGAEGRKSWQSAIDNAKEGMKNELKSQEALNTWANMQKALEDISKYQSDPEIEAPVAKAATQRYLDDVQRRNQGWAAKGVNSMINAVGDVFGVGPSVLRGVNNGVKTNLLTMFIGLGKLSHSFVTLIQPLQGIPVVSSLMRAEARASGSQMMVGNALGLRSLSATIKSFGSQVEFSKALAGKEINGFERRALDFAKQNDTLNTKQFQFGNLTDINRNRTVSGLHTAAEFNVTGMETATRAFTFMYYAHMLRDLGMSEKEIFPTAHNAMRDVMVDYNSWERPGVFGKLGLLGDLTAMLTRYKFNQIDQFMRASKYAGKGDLRPLVTVFTTAMLAAGVRGVMLYEIANKLTDEVSTWAAKNGIVQKPTSLDEMLLHMLHGTNEHFSDMVKFGLPAGLGLNMTGSLSHADDIPSDPFGALIPQLDPLGKYAQGIYGFLHNPNKATAKNMAYQISPNSMRGSEENLMFTDKDGKFYNPQTGELVTQRSEADQMKRIGGFRPLHEANEALTTKVDKETKEAQGEVKKDLVQKLLREADSNGLVPKATWEKYAQQYKANNGNPQDLIQALQDHQVYGKNLTNAQREQGLAKGGVSSALGYERYQELK